MNILGCTSHILSDYQAYELVASTLNGRSKKVLLDIVIYQYV
jgi:hypothetical protein